METAWKIGTAGQLSEIAARGAGFVIDPLNRRWHAATCTRVRGMTVGEPKWFALTPVARDGFLRQRLARYPAAKPIQACPDCGGRPAPTHGEVAASDQRCAVVERMENGFRLWADEYVRNESTAASSAGRLRRRIADEIRALPKLDGRMLHAGYAGPRAHGTDVENLLFNNIDQGLALFRVPGRGGVVFEDLGPVTPTPPDGTSRRTFYRYVLADPGEPLTTVHANHLICRVRPVIVPDGPKELAAARIWLAIRRARPVPGPGGPLEHANFLLRAFVQGLEPAAGLKAIVDGATAAMQRDDADHVRQAITRLSALLGADSDELLALATADNAPLGRKSRPSPHSKQSLFALNRAGQVRVTPDDDRCIAAQIVLAGNDRPPTLSVEVHSAEPRSPGQPASSQWAAQPMARSRPHAPDA